MTFRPASQDKSPDNIHEEDDYQLPSSLRLIVMEAWDLIVMEAWRHAGLEAAWPAWWLTTWDGG